jgi:aryl-alcohol dehydrogenase-like predicted oxidoreductase
MEALHDLVKAGKTRYLGASSMFAWQFARALGIADRHGLSRFISMLNHLNLLYREEEREMLPLCRAEGIGLLPWSPLARGRLARPWDTETERVRSDAYATTLYAGTAETDRPVVERVSRLAAAREIPMARVALAWVLEKTPSGSPIVGATRPHHLDDAVAALAVRLTAEEIASLEEPYVPHAVVGFS